MICGGENGTNGYHLAVISKYITFNHHIMATHLPPPSHPVGVLVVLAMSVKTSYLRWQAIQVAIHSAIQVAIHSIVGGYIDYKYLYRILANVMQVSFSIPE